MASSERKQHYEMWGRGLVGFGLIPLIFGLVAFLFNYPQPGSPTTPYVPGLCYYNSVMKSIFDCKASGTVSVPSLLPNGPYLTYYILMVIGVILIIAGASYISRSKTYGVINPNTPVSSA